MDRQRTEMLLREGIRKSMNLSSIKSPVSKPKQQFLMSPQRAMKGYMDDVIRKRLNNNSIYSPEYPQN